MTTTCGRHRKLTDEQIKLVLSSSKRRAAFRVSHGTISDLARRLSVHVSSIKYLRQLAGFARSWDPVRWSSLEFLERATLLNRRGGCGRRSSLTLEQQVEILQWDAQLLAAHAERGSLIELCRELGISPNTFRTCVRRDGVYKQTHRDESKLPSVRPKAGVKRSYKQRRKTIRDRENRVRAVLLRDWRAPAFDSVHRTGGG